VNSQIKYKPKTLDEFVFSSPALKASVERYAKGKTVLPMILYGPPGSGKSTLAELIPKAIDGQNVLVNKVNAEDLNSNVQVRDRFSRTEIFDKNFQIGEQSRGYSVVEEVNFNPKARGALRVVMDEMLEREQFIMTTNQLEQIDSAICSRAEKLEVLPATPEQFFARAKHIFQSEGVDLHDDDIVNVLTSVYEAHHDNREYYKAMDQIIEAWQDQAQTMGGAAQ
jgi:replication-associated recombination protein RarA